MTQLSPTNLIYAQVLDIITKLRQDYATSKYETPDEIVTLINNALVEFEKSAGKTLTKYEPISYSEVPDSQKINRFWSTLQTDINILQEQVDILRAAAIFAHNFVKTEIKQSANSNKRLLSKLKTLELYSNIDDSSLIYFGDTFISDDFIDYRLVNPDDQATILGYGHIGLGIAELEAALDNNSEVTILSGSNGFSGNNQEIVNTTNTAIDPVTGDPQFTFQAEVYDSSNTQRIIDNQPNSWFEFEKYYIDKEVRNSVFNYNFHYNTNILDNDSYIKDSSSFSIGNNGLINWANGFDEKKTGVLKLRLLIDLGSTKYTNVIKLTPYGLIDNKNNPIVVTKVIYSADGSVWDTASPENVWIANTIDRRLSTINTESIMVGSAIWVLNSTVPVRYFRFEIEQRNPIQSKVGHLLYLDEDYDESAENISNLSVLTSTTPEEVIYDDDLYYDNPLFDLEITDNQNRFGPSYDQTETSGTNNTNIQTAINSDLLPYRKLGPNPPATDPTAYYDIASGMVNGLIQKREFFEGLRWAIGIRDIEINSVVYKDSSFFISNKLNVPGIIDRVALDAEVIIPESFDKSINWIKFYISPDDGANWYPISRIQDDLLEIPELISFNDPTPLELREPGVQYVETTNVVESLRLKVEFTRPTNNQYLTPILKSYKLKIKKRV